MGGSPNIVGAPHREAKKFQNPHNLLQCEYSKDRTKIVRYNPQFFYSYNVT